MRVDTVDETAEIRAELSPSDNRRLGDREKALAGGVGALIAVVMAAALLWQATGVLVDEVFRPKAPTATTRQPLPVVAAPPLALPPLAAPTVAAPRAAPVAATAVVVVQQIPVQPTVAQATATPVPTPAPAVTSERLHTVEHGDTLFSIARRNGTTVNALVTANGLPSADAVLSVGRRLVIP